MNAPTDDEPGSSDAPAGAHSVGETLSEHERRAQRKEQKTHEKQKTEDAHGRTRTRSSIVTWCCLACVTVAIMLAFFMFYAPTKPYVDHPVHWHATLQLEICGKARNLPHTGPGEHHKGLPLIHTHDDNTIHVEGGPIMRPEDVSLGTFMDGLGVAFDADRIMEYKNGDRCPDSEAPGKLRMYVNGEESNLFRDYITKDGDELKIVFR